MATITTINNYFDKVYCLNLAKRPERMTTVLNRFKYINLNVTRFNAIDGAVVGPLWRALDNENFRLQSYVGCCLSHLSIMREALDAGYERILIIEDDVRVHRNAQELFNEMITEIKDKSINPDLIHLAYIPLTDDLSHWNYNILSTEFIGKRIIKSKNLWSLMAYGINRRLMEHILKIYDQSFPMELDRFFVTTIFSDSDFCCIASSPQLFSAEDNVSDNTHEYTPGLLLKSVDQRHAKLHDYV